jgi:hypothetical protein
MHRAMFHFGLIVRYHAWCLYSFLGSRCLGHDWFLFVWGFFHGTATVGSTGLRASCDNDEKTMRVLAGTGAEILMIVPVILDTRGE